MWAACTSSSCALAGVQVPHGFSPPSETTSGGDSPWLEDPVSRPGDEGPVKANRLCRENSVVGRRTPPMGAGEMIFAVSAVRSHCPEAQSWLVHAALRNLFSIAATAHNGS